MKKIGLLIVLAFFQLGLSAQISSALHLELPPEDETAGGSIHGKVTTTDNMPAAGVTVYLKGTLKNTITDESGNFIIKGVKTGNYTLLLSMAGLQSIEKGVIVSEGVVTPVSFVLVEDAKLLSAVLVQSQKSLNEKIVSVGKVDINPMDLPQSIAVIGQSTIKDQQALRLSDVVKNVNGIYLGTARASTQENFYARGYSFSSGNLFKNGARVNSGAMPEMSSLDKVEVLKGSAAILYGNVAPGGIINMVTKQPKFSFGGEVAVRAGSFSLLKPSVDVFGPLASGIAYRVNGTFETAESFRDVVHSTRYYINPSLLFKLGNKTELLVQGDYLLHKFTPDFGIGSLDNTKISTLSRETFLGTPWQYATTNQSTASASLKQLFRNDWKLNTIISFQKYTRDYYSTERIQADSNGKWKRPLGRSNTSEAYITAQTNLTGKFKTGALEHTLLAGIDADRYFIQNYAYNQPLIYDTINILDQSKYTPRTDIPEASKIRLIKTPTVRIGGYVQDLISISKKIKLLAGVRWSYQQARPADSTNLVTGTRSYGVSRDNQAFSPRLGLVYRVLPNSSLFASYANSFNVNSGTDVYGNALPPSIVDQFELGVKNDLISGKLSTNLTVYRIINNNLAQTAQFSADGITQNTNPSLKELTGQTTSEGVEIDLAGQPVNGLQFIAGYSYNYMRYTKTAAAKGNYVQGERLVNTPAHTANMSAFYTLRSSALKGLKMGAAVFYTGNRFGGWNNTVGQTQNYSRLIAVPHFTTVDVSAGWCLKQLSLMAKVANITNTFNYYVHENYSINPIAPRQFVATLSYKF